jgi:carboxylesterase type B
MPELVALAREVLASGKSGEVAIVAMVQELAQKLAQELGANKGTHHLRATSRRRLEKAIREAIKLGQCLPGA